MTRLIQIAAAFSLVTAADAGEPRQDLLRFTNGDQLHGTFLGIKPGPDMVWMREDVSEPVEFKTSSLRHLVLRGGRPGKALPVLSHVSLANGDRIPGTITSLQDDVLTLDSPCAGMLQIPRRQISRIAPNPLGGRVYYHGPFSEEGWLNTDVAHPDGLGPAPVETDGDEKDDDEKPAGRWEFSGSSWYWLEKQGGTGLVRRDGMPDRSMLRFNFAWKSRMALAVAFHADFKRPKIDAGEGEEPELPRFSTGDSSVLPWLFGNAYVIQINSNYLMMFRSSVDADGKPSVERIRSNVNQLRLGESGRALIEIRASRPTGHISLFVDDEFVAQWSEGDSDLLGDGEYVGKGGGFGFVTQVDNAPLRISDVITSEWNGMPDSARSMRLDDQDVVLMANGTDRFAGRIRSVADGLLEFETKHGLFRLPLGEVAEVRLAADEVAEASEEPADAVLVRYSPVGAVSGIPIRGDGESLRLSHPAAGEIDLSLESAVMIEFHASNRIIDDWDADF